jgi:nitroimidazol reductase NimA-like FMN-containing flavoprotein (pyridoxamine 5'-phosphate oxidase superfamily)
MKNTVANLLQQQAQCVLATLGDKELALHLMAYAFATELDEIYLASLENTQKVRNMRDRPDVTCLWDNRTGKNADHIEGLAMSGFGQARELTGQTERSALRLLLKRNATLKPLLHDPGVVVFSVHIVRYQWVEGYTHSMIYEPGSSAPGKN